MISLCSARARILPTPFPRRPVYQCLSLPLFSRPVFRHQGLTLPRLQRFSVDAAHTHREDLTQRLSDAVKLVAAQLPRDKARATAYFRVGLLQAPAGAEVGEAV